MRQLLQKICCFWQAGSLQKYPPPPGVADINLNSPGTVPPGKEVSAGGVHWEPSGFYLATGVHLSAFSLEGRFTALLGFSQT